MKPPYPRPGYQDAAGQVWLGTNGRWEHADPAYVCPVKSGHKEHHTAVGCCSNSLQIQWKRDKAAMTA